MDNIKEMKVYAVCNDIPIMQDEGIDFLLKTIKERKCKRILEVGTAIGYSSILMANLSDDIFVDTLEIDEERYLMALDNINNSGLMNKINVFLGDAMLFNTDNKYDLIFIDAAKSQYRRYMEHFHENINDEGIFFFDNLNFHGIVDHPELTKSRNTRQLVKKIRVFRESMLVDENYNFDFYKNIGDGVAIVSIKK